MQHIASTPLVHNAVSQTHSLVAHTISLGFVPMPHFIFAIRPVPEPSSYVLGLLAVGLLAFEVIRRCRAVRA